MWHHNLQKKTMFNWALGHLKRAWNKLLGLVGLSSTLEPTTGRRPRSVSDTQTLIMYTVPLNPLRIKAVPGDMRNSCPDLRKRNRGKTRWDPRNVVHEDAMEDERKARAAMMRMYK